MKNKNINFITAFFFSAPILLLRSTGLIFFLLLTPSLHSFSQQQFLPLNRQYNLALERQLNHRENFSHTGFKPFLSSKINGDSLEIADSTHRTDRDYKRWIGRKLKSESLILFDNRKNQEEMARDKEEFYLAIDPLFNFQYGIDFADTSLRADTVRFITNTRGVLIRADIGKKVSLMSSFLENQSFFPLYIDDFVKTYQVVPGSGRVKPFKQSGYDYALASGYVSYSPNNQLNFQVGHDKNFIGDGYRSLLLSDNAFNYPFLKITSSWWKNRIQYTNLYSQLLSLERIPASTTPEALFKPKAGTFHYLSFYPSKYVQVGFFEGMIWQRWDSTGTMPFDLNFINPVFFVNTAIYGINAKNNSLAGINLKVKILNKLALYSQFAYDGATKSGYQIGIKTFDLFKLKNLNFQMEFNKVQPHSFSHETPLQNYSHFNQALGHPLGANFGELISLIDYRRNDFFIQLKVNYSTYSQPGKNIFLSEKPEAVDPNKPYPIPAKTALYYQDYTIGYIVNRATNLNIVVGLTDRLEEVSFVGGAPEPKNYHTRFFYFAIRTSISNQYFDF